MKRNWVRLLSLAAVFATISANAQVVEEKKKEVVIEEKPAKKEMRQVIISSNSDKKEKMVIEVDGDKVTVNGKPVEEMNNKDGDVKVRVRKVKDAEALAFDNVAGAFNVFGDADSRVFMRGGQNMLAKKAMLGVSTETNDKGAEVKEVTKESAAEKIGIQKGDIITKIGDDKIENPDDLSEAVQKHKPGDKVEVKYLRNGKEMKATAELTKWKGAAAFAEVPMENFNFDFKMDDFKMPNPWTYDFGERSYGRATSTPKMGLSVQDTDNGKGVKVIEVDGDSNADKAGIKEGDIITHVDDKAVNSVDEISKLLREKKENPTVRFQLTRNGKSQNIEVRMPRKIKTADL